MERYRQDPVTRKAYMTLEQELDIRYKRGLEKAVPRALRKGGPKELMQKIGNWPKPSAITVSPLKPFPKTQAFHLRKSGRYRTA